MKPHRARWAEIDPLTLHELIRLRVDVFVVEQACPYPELDGRDVEPETEHLWTADDAGRVTAYLRVLAEPGGEARVGRVVTRPEARGRGLSGELLLAVLNETDQQGRATVLEAQSHLSGWYGRFGYAKSGEEYLEDGIPHTPMARPARPPDHSAPPAAR